MPRKAHTKSRYGCDHCRRRRVKCDEQGPPCTNCVLRQLENCTYSRILPASLIANARRASQQPLPAGASPSSLGANNRLVQPLHVNNNNNSTTTPTTNSSSSSNVGGPGLPPPSSPLQLHSVDQLELMHQFATDTYQSLCVSESETHTWQVLVPKLALKHRYLMNGILALASLHIATTLGPASAPLYTDTGLEYHSMGLEPFRRAIANLTPENCDAAFAQSIVTTAISLALPQLTATRENAVGMTENVILVFELLQGVKKILTIGQSWINLELFSQGEFWKDTSATLDEDTDSGLGRLAGLNDRIWANGDEAQYRINKDVICHLRHCFMKFSCSSDPAPVLAWLGAVDKGFVDSLRRRMPFSLLVLAHWGVLLGGLDGQRWWAKNSGRALVSELLGALTPGDPAWESCLNWVRRRMAMEYMGDRS